MNEPISSRIFWTACGVVSVPLVATIIMMLMMLANAGRMRDDIRQISVDVSAIKNDGSFGEINEKLSELLEQNRITERLLDRTR